MREDWASAKGIEVENRRMLGKRTLFIYDLPIPLLGVYTHFSNPIPPVVPFQHLYFTSQFLAKNGYDEVFNYLNQYEITLELTYEMLADVPKKLNDCHFVLAIEARNADSYLKLSDTIRILFDDYHTASMTICDMVITSPYDYKDDTKVASKAVIQDE